MARAPLGHGFIVASMPWQCCKNTDYLERKLHRQWRHRGS
jgi:hypothetical protein